MWIRLAYPYDGHDAGANANLPADVARRLIRDGRALPTDQAREADSTQTAADAAEKE